MLFTLHAQENKALLTKLYKDKGTERVNTLLKLGNYYIYKPGGVSADLDSARTFTKDAERESKQLKYQRGIAASYTLLARIAGEKQNTKESIYLAGKALEIATVNNYQDICGDAYQELYGRYNFYDELPKKTAYLEKAIAAFRIKSTKLQLADILTLGAEHYNYIGEADKAMAFIKEALGLYKAISHDDMINPYRVAGSLYAARGDYKKSIFYLLKAVDAAENKKFADEQLTHIYNQLAANYHHLNDDRQCNQYLRKSLDHALKDNNTEAVYTATNNLVQNLVNACKYKEAEKFLKNIYSRHKPVTIADIFTVKACFVRIYTELKQFTTGERYCKEIIALVSNKGKEVPPQILYNANMALSRFYLAKGDYPVARKYLDATLETVDKRSYPVQKGIYTVAYQLDSAQNNLASAIGYLKKIKTVDDSIFNIEKNKEISQLQISYESEKKDKDILLKANNISLLNKEKELQKHKFEQTSNEKNIAIAGIIIVLIAAFGFYFAYRNKLKLNNLLEKKRQEISDKNEKLNKLVEDKEWLLKEIHHRVKNNLQIVMSLLNTQSAYLTDKAAQSAIADSQRRLHSIALIHQQLYKSDNVSAIKIYRYISELVSYLKDSYDSALIKFDIKVDDIELDVAQTIPIGLILNEAITNSFKYAFTPGEKGKIKISLCQTEKDVYELLIRDNGKGLPEAFEPENCNSLGMQLLVGLSNDLNGEFKIYNDGGTVIQIVFSTNIVE